jgi:dihydroorotate dehydrogenase (NAD+) catalytic subunit
MTDMRTGFGGVSLRNPVMTASGCFGYAKEFDGLVNWNELGGVVTKGISPEYRQGNPPPRIYETQSGMLNSIGLQNVGVDGFLSEKLPYLRDIDCAVMVNIYGKSIPEYVSVTERIGTADGVDAVEANLSCPNVAAGGIEFGTTCAGIEEITKRMRAATDSTLIVKLSPNVFNVGELAKAAEAAGADGVSLINTLRGMAVDIERRRPILGTVFGGLSGPAIKPIALAQVYQVYKAVQIPIVGMGGIMSAEDVVEFLMCGAACVQIGTANFIDPRASNRIANELEEWCQTRGLGAVTELIGCLHQQ